MKTISQFIRFLCVGGIGLLILLAVTYAFTEYAHLWYFAAYVIATLCSWTCIFLMNSLFTFSGHQKEGYGAKYALFVGMYILAFAINATLVYFLTSVAGLYYLVSIIIATAVTTLITFTFSKKIIFT